MMDRIASLNEVQDWIKAMEARLAMYKAVRADLAKFEGKLINAKMETAIRKAHPEWSAFFDKSCAWWKIEVWGGVVTYPDRLDITLGYFSEGDRFSLKRFDVLNHRYELDEKRLETAYRPALADYANRVDAYVKAYAALESARIALGPIRWASK